MFTNWSWTDTLSKYVFTHLFFSLTYLALYGLFSQWFWCKYARKYVFQSQATVMTTAHSSEPLIETLGTKRSFPSTCCL